VFLSPCLNTSSFVAVDTPGLQTEHAHFLRYSPDSHDKIGRRASHPPLLLRTLDTPDVIGPIYRDSLDFMTGAVPGHRCMWEPVGGPVPRTCIQSSLLAVLLSVQVLRFSLCMRTYFVSIFHIRPHSANAAWSSRIFPWSVSTLSRCIDWLRGVMGYIENSACRIYSTFDAQGRYARLGIQCFG
jgi:hypothetical protein